MATFDLDSIKSEALQYVDSISGRLREVSLAIHSYAEPPFQDYQSSELLASALRDGGFAVEKPIAGLDTAFRGISSKGAEQPRIFFTAEYDAIRVF